MVKITPEQINKLYEFIGETPPDVVTTEDLSVVIIKLEKKLTPYYLEEIENTSIKTDKNVLVIDDLEVSLFQLSKLIAKSGYKSFIARTTYEALDLYKKQDFDHIFLDLFLPEAEDGLHLLEELLKINKAKNKDSKIVIISGSEDKDLINKCFEKGAFDFIPKNKSWHIKILDTLRRLDEIKRGPSPEIKTTIEDEEQKIAYIKVKNIFKTGIIDDLKREALNLAGSGYKNLILDFENITTTNSEILNLIVNIFKICNQNKGTLKLCNVHPSLTEALSFVFLDGVIPIFNSKQTALDDFYAGKKS